MGSWVHMSAWLKVFSGRRWRCVPLDLSLIHISPERVAKAMLTLTRGYEQDPHAILLGAKFKEEYLSLIHILRMFVHLMCWSWRLPLFPVPWLWHCMVILMYQLLTNCRRAEMCIRDSCNIILYHRLPTSFCCGVCWKRYGCFVLLHLFYSRLCG